MSAVAYEPYAPRAAGFWTVLGATFLGFVFALLALVPVMLLALLLGIAGRDTVDHERAGPLDWPWRYSGVWSLCANVAATLLIIGVTTLAVRALVASRVDDHVSLPRTLAILVATGYAPYIAYRGLLPLHFLIALPLTAYLIRRFAVGRRSPALARSGRTMLIAALAAALALAAAYGATHPLWYAGELQATGAARAPSYQTHRVVYRYRPGATVKYGLVVSNSSFADATLVSAHGRSGAFRVVDAGIGIGNPYSPRAPLRSAPLAGRGDQYVTLVLRIERCGPGRPSTLDRVTFRYRMFGLTFSQPVALAIRPTVFCSA